MYPSFLARLYALTRKWRRQHHANDMENHHAKNLVIPIKVSYALLQQDEDTTFPWMTVMIFAFYILRNDLEVGWRE